MKTDQKSLVIWLIGAVLVTMLYWPALVKTYGITDDYSMLKFALEEPGGMTRFVASSGRLVYAPLREYSAYWAGNVENLRWLRGLSLLGILVFGFQMYRGLLRFGWPGLISSGVALWLMVMPPALVIVSWATCWPYPWALVLVALAFHCGEKWRALAFRNIRCGWGWWLLAVGLLIISMWIYQIFIFAYIWWIAAAWIYREKEEVWAGSGWLLGHFSVIGSALLCGFFGYRWILGSFGIDALSRTEIVFPGFDKIAWAVKSVVPMAWNPWILPAHDGRNSMLFYGGAAALLGAVAILIGLKLKSRTAAGASALGAFLLGQPVAYGLMFVISESYASYRTLYVVMGLTILWIGWSFGQLGEKFPGRRNWVSAVFVSLLGLNLFLGRIYLVDWVVGPQAAEYAIVLDEIHNADPDLLEQGVYVIRPEYDQTLAPWVTTNEFGLPSTHTEWAAEAMPWLAFRQVADASADLKVESGTGVPQDTEYSGLVLDLRSFALSAE